MHPQVFLAETSGIANSLTPQTWTLPNGTYRAVLFNAIDTDETLVLSTTPGASVLPTTSRATFTLLDCGTPVPGDLNGDGVVDMDDLNDVVSCFGQAAPLTPPCDFADVASPPDGDGVINILDISFVGSNFTP